MSIRVMSEVWDRAGVGGNELLVLLAIADHADDTGLAYPSVKRIAAKTRISERTVQRILVDLERRREITVRRSVGRGNASRYYVNAIRNDYAPEREKVTPGKGDNLSDSAADQVQADDSLSPFPSDSEGEKVTGAPADDRKGDKRTTEKVTNGPVKGDTAMSPEPSGIRQKEPSEVKNAQAREVDRDEYVDRLTLRQEVEIREYLAFDDVEDLADEYAGRFGGEARVRAAIADCVNRAAFASARDKVLHVRAFLDRAIELGARPRPGRAARVPADAGRWKGFAD